MYPHERLEVLHKCHVCVVETPMCTLGLASRLLLPDFHKALEHFCTLYECCLCLLD